MKEVLIYRAEYFGDAEETEAGNQLMTDADTSLLYREAGRVPVEWYLVKPDQYGLSNQFEKISR